MVTRESFGFGTMSTLLNREAGIVNIITRSRFACKLLSSLLRGAGFESRTGAVIEMAVGACDDSSSFAGVENTPMNRANRPFSCKRGSAGGGGWPGERSWVRCGKRYSSGRSGDFPGARGGGSDGALPVWDPPNSPPLLVIPLLTSYDVVATIMGSYFRISLTPAAAPARVGVVVVAGGEGRRGVMGW